MLPSSLPSETEPLTIAGLNQRVRETLETCFPLLWVSGEISNLTRASSGHIYFTLKDEQAQVRCTIWRNRAQLLSFRPENGQRVKARVLVTLYEARGDYQLNVETLRPEGTGSLFEAFTRLKEKLSSEGLFDPALRRPIPLYPRTIGIITSPAAAALQDVKASLQRRAPHLQLILYPAAVQGAEAPAQLLSALNQAIRRHEQDHTDILLLVRGGGSLEDLWAFNHEPLARALRAAPMPVITGIGHETDFTIADFVADLRAPTPTGAAELASAGYHAAAAQLITLASRLRQNLYRQLQKFEQRVDHASLQLIHPRARLQQTLTQTQEFGRRLHHAAQQNRLHARYRLTPLATRLHNRRPDSRPLHLLTQQAAQQLETGIQRLLHLQHNRLETLQTHLQHLNPNAVLARGYSIIRTHHGTILRNSADITAGDTLLIQLAQGKIEATADVIQPPSDQTTSHPENT